MTAQDKASTYGISYFKLKLEILRFLVKMLFNGHGVGTSASEYRVSFNITDEDGNYEILTFKRGNNYD